MHIPRQRHVKIGCSELKTPIFPTRYIHSMLAVSMPWVMVPIFDWHSLLMCVRLVRRTQAFDYAMCRWLTSPDRCVQATSDVSKTMCTCHCKCRLTYAHTPHLMHTCLGWCHLTLADTWWQWTMSPYRCAHAMGDGLRLLLLMISLVDVVRHMCISFVWYVQAMTDVT